MKKVISVLIAIVLVFSAFGSTAPYVFAADDSLEQAAANATPLAPAIRNYFTAPIGEENAIWLKYTAEIDGNYLIGPMSGDGEWMGGRVYDNDLVEISSTESGGGVYFESYLQAGETVYFKIWSKQTAPLCQKLVVENFDLGHSPTAANETSNTVAAGSNLTLSIIDSSDYVSYQWYRIDGSAMWFDGRSTVLLDGETGYSLTLNDIQSSNEYYCLVKKNDGSYGSSRFVVTVDNELTVSAYNDISTIPVEKNTPFELRVNASSGQGEVYYQWYKEVTSGDPNSEPNDYHYWDEPISGADSAVLQVEGIESDTYYSCVVKDKYDNYNVAGFMVKVNAVPDAVDLPLAVPASVTLPAGEDNAAWFRIDASHMSSQSGIYHISIFNSGGFDYAQKVYDSDLQQIAPVDPDTHEYALSSDQTYYYKVWSEELDGNGVTVPVTTPICAYCDTFLYVDPVEYNVQASYGGSVTLSFVNNGNYWVDRFYKGYGVPVEMRYSSSVTSNNTTSVTIDNITFSGTYFCRVRDNNGNMGSCSFNVIVDSPVEARAEQAVVQNDPAGVTLKAIGTSPEGPVHYQWYKVDLGQLSILNGETSDTLSVSGLAKTQQYCCRVSDTAGNEREVYFLVEDSSDIIVLKTGHDCDAIKDPYNETLPVWIDSVPGDEYWLKYTAEQTGVYFLGGVAGGGSALDETVLYDGSLNVIYNPINAEAGETFYIRFSTFDISLSEDPDEELYSLGKFVAWQNLNYENHSIVWGEYKTETIVITDYGMPVELKVDAFSPAGFVECQWFLNGTEISSKQTYPCDHLNPVSITTGPVTEDLEYVCSVTYPDGTQDEVRFHVGVKLTAEINGDQKRYIQSGDDIELSVSAKAHYNDFTYTWYEVVNGTPTVIADSNNAAITVSNVTDIRYFYCTVENGNGETDTTKTVEVYPIDAGISYDANNTGLAPVIVTDDELSIVGSIVPDAAITDAANNNEHITVTLIVDEGSEDPQDQAAIDDLISSSFQGIDPDDVYYFTIDLEYQVGQGSAQEVTATYEPISITIDIPASIYDSNKTYAVIRVHNGVAEIVPSVFDKDTLKLTIISDKFSSYALATVEEGYTVEFVDDDGTVLQSGIVAFGEMPQYGGATPVKEDSAYYSYEFAGWTPALTAVTRDATYTATYNAIETAHNWGVPSFNWPESVTDPFDTVYVTATRICSNDGSHVETETVAAQGSGYSPICTMDGYASFTAYFENPAFGVQTKDYSIPATGHIPGEPARENWYTDVDSSGVDDAPLAYICFYDQVVRCSACGELLSREQFSNPLPASGTCGADGDNLTWTISSMGYLDISGTGAMADYSHEMPAPWYDYAGIIYNLKFDDSVTSIGSYAFKDCIAINGISLPVSLSSIGDYAFSDCKSLQSFSLGMSVSYVGKHCFENCNSLSWFTYPNPTMITRIEEGTFENCTSLYSVSMPDGFITSICDYAFAGCSSLNSIAVPNGVTSIGRYAFSSCSTLWSISLPDSITSLGGGAFVDCRSLSSISLPEAITEISKELFYNCSMLSAITIPNDVSVIGPDAFYGCSINSVAIPVSVTRIDENAFAGCYSLGQVYYSGSREEWNSIDIRSGNEPLLNAYIQYDYNPTIASGNCGSWGWNLSWALDSKGVLTISGEGPMTDYDHRNMTGSIGSAPWYEYRNKIKSVVLDSRITSIGSSAFYGCTALKEITIPENVTYIGNNAFLECTGLTGINYNARSISPLNYDSNVFGNAGINDAGITVVFGDEVQAVPAYLFYGTSGYDNNGNYVGYSSANLVNVVLGGSITSIGDQAFYNCPGLVSIDITQGVQTIGSSAFALCSGLSAVYIPQSMVLISAGAFSMCSGITDVYYPGTEAEWNNISIGYDNDYLLGANIYYDYYYIIDSGTCGAYGDNLTWVLDSKGVLAIAGEGPMADYEWGMAPWFGNRNKISTIVLSQDATSVGAYTFADCQTIKAVSLPDSVLTIGDGAFDECYSLNSVEFGNGLLSIGDHAFWGCNSLTSVVIPDSVKTIKRAAFKYCESLASVSLPEGLTTLEGGAFTGCGSLTSIVLPSTLTEISDHLFFGSGLVSITIPGNIKTIGFEAFSQCYNLSSIDISEGVLAIDDGAFAYCENLTEIVVPDSVVSLGSEGTAGKGSGLFSGCYSLNRIVIGSGVTNVCDWAFDSCENLKEIIFKGHAPRLENSTFVRVIAVAYYPGFDKTWTPDVLRQYNYGSGMSCSVTWVPYGIPEYEWAEDHSSVAATVLMPTVEGHYITENVETSYQVVQTATCEKDGVGRYIASFEDEAFTFQTVDVAIPAIGHNYNQFEYDWLYDDGIVLATAICANDHSHVVSELASTSSEITEPATCDEDGKEIVTAEFSNPMFTAQQKEKVIKATGHSYGDPIYTWSEDLAKVTAKVVCADDETHKIEETVNTFNLTGDAATCEMAGIKMYLAVFTSDVFSTQIKQTEIPALGHDMVPHEAKAATCTEVGWNAYEACSRCDHSTYVEIPALGHALVHHDAKAATCTAIGWDAYDTCSRCDYTTYEEITALGHLYGAPVYIWSEDLAEVTAKVICANDDAHKIEETVSALYLTGEAATCDAAGTGVYLAVFTNSLFSTQIKQVEIPSLGHDWSDPTYTWADDNSSVTAVRSCRHDASHVESERVDTTYAIVTPATETQSGVGRYTAIFISDAFETQTKEIVLQPTGFVISYEWSADNKTVIGTAVPYAQGAPTITETVSAAYSVVTPSTCTAAGLGQWTSAPFENAQFTVQTKAVDIPALGHDWEFVDFTWTGSDAAGYAAAVANYVCGNDESHKQTVDATVTSAEGEDENAGYNIYTAAVTAAVSFDEEAHSDEKRTLISYTIKYDLAGGTVSVANPASYTVVSDAITLNNPTKEGYVFAGWTGTGLDSATKTVTIAKGSIGNRTYTAMWEAAMPVDIRRSISLNEQIAINAYIGRLPEGADRSEYTVKVFCDDEEVSSTAFDTLGDGMSLTFDNIESTYYYLNIVELSAKMLTDEFVVKVFHKDTGVAESTFSVRDYCELCISQGRQTLLCRATLTYGAEAQEYFGYKTDDLADKNIERVTLTNIPAEFAISGDPMLQGIKELKMSASLESQIFANLYFIPESGYGVNDFTYSVKLGDTTYDVTAQTSGNYIYLRLPAVVSRNLGTNFDITVTNKATGASATWHRSVMNYCYNAQSSAKMTDLVRAMYQYYLAAK